MKPNWKNLNSNDCPKCGKPLTVMEKVVICVLPCEFTIKRDKMEQIKYNMSNNIHSSGTRNFEEGYG